MSELNEIARAAQSAKKPQVVEIKSAAETMSSTFVARSFVGGFFGCLGVVLALYLTLQLLRVVGQYNLDKWIQENVPLETAK